MNEISTIKELGDLLKKAREKKGIQLESIQKNTKIRLKYLHAIEDGEFSAIPGGDVYIKGFLKNYAEAVGLPPSEILLLYKKICCIKNKEIPKPEENHSDHEPLEYAEVQKRSFKFMSIAMMVLAFLTLMFYGIKSFQHKPASYSNEKLQDQLHQPVQIPDSKQQENVLGDGSQQTSGNINKAVVEVMEDSSNNTIYTVQAKTIDVVVETIQGRCWISVRKDGKMDYEGILTQEDKKIWTADEELVIRVGNPQVIKLNVNGQDFGIIGGKTRNLIFKRRE
jgi:cytoskeletal protein RodZ